MSFRLLSLFVLFILSLNKRFNAIPSLCDCDVTTPTPSQCLDLDTPETNKCTLRNCESTYLCNISDSFVCTFESVSAPVLVLNGSDLGEGVFPCYPDIVPMVKTVNVNSFEFVPDFQTDLSLNGNTSSLSNNLRLTESSPNKTGSAWLPTWKFAPTTIFETFFRFHIINNQGSEPGSGFTFMVQTAGASALGKIGADLGYADESNNGLDRIDSSFGIEFDTHLDPPPFYDDTNGSHMQLILNGSARGNLQRVKTGAAFDNSLIQCVWIQSNGTQSLDVYVKNSCLGPEEFSLATKFNFAIPAPMVDYIGQSGIAYMGFTSATGLDYSQRVQISDWTVTMFF